jgi:hypothetical protein
MSGDDKFSAVVSKILRACLLDGSMAWSCVVFAFAFVYICGLVYSVLNKKARTVNSFGADTVISVSFLTPVNLLFLFFFISQLGYVEEGTFVYSEYAREGFFQLLLVTFINFGIIFAFTGIFKTNSRVVKYMLTALCVFTFMLILSSYYRMFLYIRVYGFTQMRVEVLGFLTAETVLVFITVYHILKDKQGLLKYFALCGFICLFVLNIVARPEVSADINYRILEDKSNVLEDVYYSEVILTDRLYQDGKISRYKAKSLIKDMDRYGNNGKSENWQSFSIQHYMCDKVLEKWGV